MSAGPGEQSYTPCLSTPPLHRSVYSDLLQKGRATTGDTKGRKVKLFLRVIKTAEYFYTHSICQRPNMYLHTTVLSFFMFYSLKISCMRTTHFHHIHSYYLSSNLRRTAQLFSLPNSWPLYYSSLITHCV